MQRTAGYASARISISSQQKTANVLRVVYPAAAKANRSADFAQRGGEMNINVTCEKHNVAMKVIRQWSSRGDIEVTVEPCPECIEEENMQPDLGYACGHGYFKGCCVVKGCLNNSHTHPNH